MMNMCFSTVTGCGYGHVVNNIEHAQHKIGLLRHLANLSSNKKKIGVEIQIQSQHKNVHPILPIKPMNILCYITAVQAQMRPQRQDQLSMISHLLAQCRGARSATRMSTASNTIPRMAIRRMASEYQSRRINQFGSWTIMEP